MIYGTCTLCGASGMMELHHVFPGALRSKSGDLGYLEPLCGEKCHRLGRYAVHQCRQTADKLKEYFQIRYMIEHHASIADCRKVFYKNYVSEAYYEDERDFDMYLNMIAIGGWLTKDPYLNETRNGEKVAHFRIACKRTKTITDFFNCEAWGEDAEFVMERYKKGSFVQLGGFLRQNDFKKDGTTVNNCVIVGHSFYFWGRTDIEDNPGPPDGEYHSARKDDVGPDNPPKPVADDDSEDEDLPY